MPRPVRKASRLGALAMLTIAAGSASCSNDETTASPKPSGPRISLTSGKASLVVDLGGGEVDLARGDRTLLRFPLDALELGTVPAVDDITNYDPYRLYVPNPVYGALPVTWVDPTSATLASSTATHLAIELTYPNGIAATLNLDASAPQSFSAKLVPTKGVDTIAFFRLRPRGDAKEGFYGLGESYDDVNQRGKVRAMQLEFDTSTESGHNEAHVPIPMLLGTTGWGIFVESRFPGAFAVAKDAPDLVEAAFGTGKASAEGLTFHVFAEERPIDLPRHYYDLTGAPLLPARWALGPWVWRDENKNQAQVESDLATMRAKDLPATGYWIDHPYSTAIESFDFDPAKFTDPKSMIDKAHDLGFRMALWHVPYLEDAGAAKSLHDEAVTKGYFPPENGLVLNKDWGVPLDFTNPAAFTFWQDHVRTYTFLGVEGFKLDYAEDVLLGIGNKRNVWRFSDGSDERTMHSEYPLHYHRVYGETLPKEGGFLLCRAGAYGDQKNVSVIWPGDLDARMVKVGEKVKEGSDSWVAVGGLAASMIAGLSLGPSGFPFYGADTGGYRHSPPDKETFVRWFEQTALSTVMQSGNSASTVAWEPDATTGYDDELLELYRTYTRLHLRLFPYEWTYATNLAKDGRPIQRPLGLAFPELGVHPSDEYLFGDSLLVAPVVERGQTKRDVVFPPGRWLDYWTGEAVEGPATVSVDAPLGKLPLYLAAGGIVPLLRPTIDTTAPTTAPDEVDSYATTPGLLYARVAPEAPGSSPSSFRVFDGAELSSATAMDGSITLASTSGNEFAFGAVFELFAGPSPVTAVTSNGLPMTKFQSLADLEAGSSGYYDEMATAHVVYVKLPAGSQAAVVAF